jgi:hypothetical protein
MMSRVGQIAPSFMQTFVLLIMLLTSTCAAAGQQATPTPPPTPASDNPKLKHIGTITGISRSLRRLSKTDPKFEGKEDFFRIGLPQPFTAYKPAGWPKAYGEMPVPSRTTWHMEEAEIMVSVTPIPPGLIQSWSAEELLLNLSDTIDRGVKNASAKVIYEKDSNMGNIRGREAKATARGKTMLMRVFFANDRQYLIGAQLKDAADAESLVKTLFDTFEILVATKNMA